MRRLFFKVKPSRFLLPLSWPYSLGADLKNLLYDRGIAASISAGIPTLSVGNLSAGGTGKTPQVLWLIKALESTFQIGVLSRGYGRKSGAYLRVSTNSRASEVGDEPLLIKQLCPRTAVAVCADRVEGAKRLREEEPGIDLLILDDAFQHRRIARHFDLLLSRFDAPWWSDRVLPAGYLRESGRGAQRADAVVFTACPSDLDRKKAREMAVRARRSFGLDCFFSTRVYGALKSLEGKPMAPSPEDQIFLLSGIAHPRAFEEYLRGLLPNRSINSMALADHATIDASVVERIRLAAGGRSFSVVMTEKDAVRLDSSWPSDWPSFVLPLEVEFLFNGREVFLQRLLAQVSKALG